MKYLLNFNKIINTKLRKTCIRLVIRLIYSYLLYKNTHYCLSRYLLLFFCLWFLLYKLYLFISFNEFFLRLFFRKIHFLILKQLLILRFINQKYFIRFCLFNLFYCSMLCIINCFFFRFRRFFQMKIFLLVQIVIFLLFYFLDSTNFKILLISSCINTITRYCAPIIVTWKIPKAYVLHVNIIGKEDSYKKQPLIIKHKDVLKKYLIPNFPLQLTENPIIVNRQKTIEFAKKLNLYFPKEQSSSIFKSILSSSKNVNNIYNPLFYNTSSLLPGQQLIDSIYADAIKKNINLTNALQNEKQILQQILDNQNKITQELKYSRLFISPVFFPQISFIKQYSRLVSTYIENSESFTLLKYNTKYNNFMPNLKCSLLLENDFIALIRAQRLKLSLKTYESLTNQYELRKYVYFNNINSNFCISLKQTAKEQMRAIEILLAQSNRLSTNTVNRFFCPSLSSSKATYNYLFSNDILTRESLNLALHKINKFRITEFSDFYKNREFRIYLRNYYEQIIQKKFNKENNSITIEDLQFIMKLRENALNSFLLLKIKVLQVEEQALLDFSNNTIPQLKEESYILKLQQSAVILLVPVAYFLCRTVLSYFFK